MRKLIMWNVISLDGYFEGEKAWDLEFHDLAWGVVCSSTLKTANWKNTTIVIDAVNQISKLKQVGDGNMFVFGSGILSESLMKANLFDEYRLCVSPVFSGKGRRLFNEDLPYKKLKLLEARSLSTGGVLLRYAPDQI